MPDFKINLLAVLLFIASAAYGQKDYYTLDGRVNVRSGATYKYQLCFTEKKGRIKGYSLTWLEKAAPSKALIEGKIDRKHKLLSFSETEVVNSTLLKTETMCLFNSVLSYKQSGNIYDVSGTFRGTDVNGVYCGDGTMSFTHPVSGDHILGNPKVVKPPQETVKLKDSTAGRVTAEPKKESIPETELLTFGKNKVLDWHEQTLILDVWDYGTPDGDVVTISLNGKAVLSGYTMVSDKKRLVLKLEEGENTLTILAENEGSVPPNTARLLLTDGVKQYNLTAYNEEGRSASIILRRIK